MLKEQQISFELARLAFMHGFLPSKYWYTTTDYFDTSDCSIRSTEKINDFWLHGWNHEKIYMRTTQSLLQKWFREELNIDIEVFRHKNASELFNAKFNQKYLYDDIALNVLTRFNTYEEGLEAVMIEALNFKIN